MAQIKVDRKLYDLVSETKSPDFVELEKVENEGAGNIIVAVFLETGGSGSEELDKWYNEEHIPMLQKVPGFLRCRRFVTSSIDKNAKTEYLALYDYAPQNGLGGKEHAASTATPWAKKVMGTVVKGKGRRSYGLYYTFGPAPRYLSTKMAAWKSSDVKASRTETIPDSPGGAGAIESFITTKDGVELPFRLDGSPEVDAPLIVLSNSILVDYGIWDAFLVKFFSNPVNKKYRVLRYLTRGRNTLPSSATQAITIDVLASDIITILDALRVKKAEAIIGVSLGGCTTLNAALKYPSRVKSFISCDTSAKSPAGNSKAWGERVAMSEKEGLNTQSGEAIVGEELAEITTRRWFVPESYSNPDLEPTLLKVKEMVKNNSREGFKKSVNALFEYDMKDAMKDAKVKGMFLVGANDGVLPKTMKEMSESYGSGAEYVVIEGAGHLPMVEKPERFAEVVSKFLA